MKIKFVTLLLVCATLTFAQSPIEKSMIVKTGQNLEINLDDPAITLHTWEKSEVLIKGTVSINRGENDTAFELQTESTANEIRVTAILKDKDKIPQRIIIKKGEMEYYFKTKNFNDPEVQKFLEANGGEYSYMSNGIIKDIKLDIFVPKKMETHVIAKYGMVEVKSFDAPLSIESKYGGVDATLAVSTTGDLTARTRYGEILTNLDVKFDQTNFMGRGNNWTEIHAKPGTGPTVRVESTYGNVYLRKPN